MKTINKNIDIDISFNCAIDMYFSSKNFAILDIETTGLSPSYSSIILIGLIKVFNNGNQKLHQLFAVSPDEEPELLYKLTELLNDVDYLITFNGKSFDLPFINKRCNKYGIASVQKFNLDLFLFLKHYSDLPNFLKKMNQKSLEEYAGIAQLRQDRISGGESVDLYSSYLENGSLDLEKRILLHNRDDIMQLLRLTSLIRNADCDRAFYSTGFPFSYGNISKCSLKRDELIVKGVADLAMEYISFPTTESPYYFRMSGTDGEFELSLPLDTLEDNVFIRIDDLLSSNAVSKMPSVVNGHIILKENGNIKYVAANLLSRELLNQIFGRIMNQ